MTIFKQTALINDDFPDEFKPYNKIDDTESLLFNNDISLLIYSYSSFTRSIIGWRIDFASK